MASFNDHEKLAIASDVVNVLPVDPGKVLRKLDLRLVPLVCVFYLLYVLYETLLPLTMRYLKTKPTIR